jgi:hypothetical protein
LCFVVHLFFKDSSCLFIDKDYLSYILLIDSGFFRPTFVTNSLKIHIFLEVLFTPFCYFHYYLFYFILFYSFNYRYIFWCVFCFCFMLLFCFGISFYLMVICISSCWTRARLYIYLKNIILKLLDSIFGRIYWISLLDRSLTLKTSLGEAKNLSF